MNIWLDVCSKISYKKKAIDGEVQNYNTIFISKQEVSSNKIILYVGR